MRLEIWTNCVLWVLPQRDGDQHGKSHERIYSTWSGMTARCQNPKDPAYKNYGGRGISVCSEWQDFEAFREWALQNGYQDDLTIERKDVNGNYCPENCCFIPKAEQSKNRRNTFKITAWGETKTGAEWLQDPRCNVSSMDGLKMRILRKMPPEKAISTPPRNRNTQEISA
jgi:hypothetical protein